MNYPAAPLGRDLRFALTATGYCAPARHCHACWHSSWLLYLAMAGGSDFHNLKAASFGKFKPITHENLCLPRLPCGIPDWSGAFLRGRSARSYRGNLCNLRNLWIKIEVPGGSAVWTIFHFYSLPQRRKGRRGHSFLLLSVERTESNNGHLQ